MTISLSDRNGFTGSVSLSLSSSSEDLACTVSPAAIAGSQTATLTCEGNTPKAYVVTITGTSGSTTRTTTVMITVTSSPILGLDLTSFYAIVGTIMVVLVAMVAYRASKHRTRIVEILCQ